MHIIKEGIKRAKEAQKLSYSPYSKFPIGAALFFKDGSYVLGSNVENGSYGLTVCAERNAIFSAVLGKKNMKEATHLFVYGNTSKPISPCGACRQVMAEFFSEDVKIILISKDEKIEEFTLSGLLPYKFEF